MPFKPGHAKVGGRAKGSVNKITRLRQEAVAETAAALGLEVPPRKAQLEIHLQVPARYKPFFMDVNFIKMHNPTNAAPAFRDRSHLGDYSDSLIEMDDDIGRIVNELRAEAPIQLSS
jgi:hypothetical protein